MANYFRNTDFLNVDGQSIEPLSLWERHENKMVLIDDDNHVTVDYDEKMFVIEKSQI